MRILYAGHHQQCVGGADAGVRQRISKKELFRDQISLNY